MAFGSRLRAQARDFAGGTAGMCRRQYAFVQSNTPCTLCPLPFTPFPFQAVVCLLFNDTEELGYSEVQERANLQDDDCLRLLHSLTCAKYKILAKEPAGGGVYTAREEEWAVGCRGSRGQMLDCVWSGRGVVSSRVLTPVLCWCLLHRAAGKTISKSDKFRFNAKFTDRMHRIKIPLPPVDEKKKVSGGAGVCGQHFPPHKLRLLMACLLAVR